MSNTKSEYFFAILTSCERRILKKGDALHCRVVKVTRTGLPDVYHVGAKGYEKFVIVREPVFSKIVGVEKYAALGSSWQENLEFALADKIKLTSQDEKTDY